MENLTYIQVLVRIVSLAASAAEKETLTTKKRIENWKIKKVRKKQSNKTRPAEQNQTSQTSQA